MANSVESPTLISYRTGSTKKTALIFVHGFTGSNEGTWGSFPVHLLGDRRLNQWDIFSFGYPSSRGFDIPGLWAADPGIKKLAASFASALTSAPLSSYAAFIIVAHSMGGLVAQRAILDNAASVEARVQHLLLFGTPSAGLKKARFGQWWKRQIRDMRYDSDFIRDLENDRSGRWFSGPSPLQILAIAGERDEFVPAESSLTPFPAQCRAVVPGNHLEIVKPTSANHRSVELVRDVMRGKGYAPTVIDGAMVAVEQRLFQQAATSLLPRARSLDETATVSLALALEGLGRREDALAVLQNAAITGTDALGVMAGRIKRRWLVQRQQQDWDASRDLYARALDMAERNADHEQAYYHAINVAFLDLLKLPQSAPVSKAVTAMARRALAHCGKAAPSSWRYATEGEAMLMLDKFPKACANYRQAIENIRSPREAQSMFGQAMRVAERIGGTAAADQIAQMFNPVGM